MTEIFNPYDDIAVAVLNEESDTRYGSQYLTDVRSLQVGYGSKVLRVDDQGIWLGAATFASAPFSVDMDGNIVATSLTLASLSGDLDDIADGLTYAKTTLNAALGAGYAYSGLNTSGEIIKGFLNTQLSAKSLPADGVRVDSSGIYGRKASVTTFYISNAGDAYFSGDIYASTITGSTITGAVLQTATSGQRVVITGSNNDVRFYDSAGTYQGRIVGSTSGSGSVFITGVNGASIGVGSTIYMYATGASAEMILAKDMLPVGSVRLGDLGSEFTSVWGDTLVTSSIATLGGQIDVTGGFYPLTDSLYDLGNTTYRWSKIWADSADIGAITGTSITVGSGSLRAGGYHYFNSGNNSVYLYSTGSYLSLADASGTYSSLANLKSAIVPTSKGYNALYCMESPEVWFMDFIKKDKKLDPLFKEVTESPYHYVKCVGGEYQVWGKRKGFKNTRFETKTENEFMSNEKYLALSKTM